MFDKKIVKKNFSRGAKNYDEAALVQKITADELFNVSKEFIVKNQKILDLGSGSSFLAKKISENFLQGNLKIFELDLSVDMLELWCDRPENIFAIQGDIEQIPFQNHSFDIIFSSFSLQWVKNFPQNFLNFFSLLKSGGVFAFCLPTEGSLEEIRAKNIFKINDFPQVKALKAALEKSGFEEFFFETKLLKQEFNNGFEALKSLKKIGANYSEEKTKAVTKAQLKRFNDDCSKFTISWKVSNFIFFKK